jgi:hypothetical protein
MAKKIGIGVVAVLVVLIGVIAMQPSHFHYERSATVPATPDVAFAQVNDFHAWPAWNPFAKDDPSEKVEYSGPASGVGAITTWKGNDKVGEGKMTIDQSEAAKSVGIVLEFQKPFAATDHVVFTFTPEGANTKVTWAMDGERNFGMKAAGLVMNMEKMLGTKFDEGLADLGKASAAEMKKRAEAKAAAAQPPAPEAAPATGAP